MIHFWYSINITDTFRVYQYHKQLIYDCDTFSGIQNSLLTRFAICVNSHISQFILEPKASTGITILCFHLMALILQFTF